MVIDDRYYLLPSASLTDMTYPECRPQCLHDKSYLTLQLHSITFDQPYIGHCHF